MEAWIWIVIVVLVVAVVAAVAYAMMQRRTAALREQFGPEYDRTVASTDSRRDAESELAARRKRREELEIRPLSAAAYERYSTEWREVQARFVDQPAASLLEADRLVLALMRERGYPMDDFEQRAADLSVDHPVVVDNYRAGHAISGRVETGSASTEDMRQGLIHYRALFEDLLETGDERATEVR